MAEAKVKQLEEKLRQEEGRQIVSDVASYNLSPEQLAQFLELAGNGKLQELLNGQVKMPGSGKTENTNDNAESELNDSDREDFTDEDCDENEEDE